MFTTVVTPITAVRIAAAAKDLHAVPRVVSTRSRPATSMSEMQNAM